jgi:hypothetical protein
MSGSCGDIGELLPEYALGTLTGSAALEAEDHTNRCVACRTRLAELTGVADAVLVLAPEHEPSSSFTSRVDAAIVADGSGHRRFARHRVWVATAAAAAVLALVAGGVAIGRASAPQRSTTVAEAREIHEESMIGAGGRPAGHVLLYRGAPTMAVVSVDYGTLPAGEYAVATTGSAADAAVGRVTVDAKGRGAWGGTLGRGHVTGVRIVDDAGHVLCEARFDVGRPRGAQSSGGASS